MYKKLVRHGNSSALILDKPILELLNITENTILKLTTDGTSLIITPMPEEGSGSWSSQDQILKPFNEYQKYYQHDVKKD